MKKNGSENFQNRQTSVMDKISYLLVFTCSIFLACQISRHVTRPQYQTLRLSLSLAMASPQNKILSLQHLIS